jgi:hypothetical protein
MLHKCANPVCPVQFRFLNQGKLFEIEIQYLESPSGDQCKRCNDKRQFAWYWLCNLCEVGNTLRFDSARGLVTISSLAGSKCMETTISEITPKAVAGISQVLIRPIGQDWKTSVRREEHVELTF